MSDPFHKTAEPKGSGNYDLCPADNHPAILIGLVDLGTQEDEYKGKKTESRRLLVVWETPGELKPDGTPYILTKQYANYFKAESKLRDMIEKWRGLNFRDGEEFDLLSILDKPCLLNVTHSTSGDKTYHQIGGISKLTKGSAVPRRHHDVFTFIVGEQDPATLDWLPWSYGESITEIVKRSQEYRAFDSRPAPAPAPSSRARTEAAKVAVPAAPKVEDDDGIPF